MCELSVRMSEDVPLFHHTSSWFGVQFATGTDSPFVNEYQNQWECKVRRNAFGDSKFNVSFSWSVHAFKLPFFCDSCSWHIGCGVRERVEVITDTFSSCLRLAWLSDNVKNIRISEIGIMWRIWAWNCAVHLLRRSIWVLERWHWRKLCALIQRR